MALNLQDKKAIVTEVNEAASVALSAVVADSCGIAVGAMTSLRKKAREMGVYIRVVRNTLARRAVEGTDYECLRNAFVGSTLIAFSNEHLGSAARILKNFSKENKDFEIKAAAFQGVLTDVDKLAMLPTYDEAIARLMMCMKEASAGKLVRTIEAIRDHKEAA
ncbi:50S ribosomal protein L10 [Candidatus Enterovibrio escicola]|uniref:Large ribosomal subunit protein uL10 n=1 Tax=Candidatus Enterovibrio escicola TaxID=1927127 RepID=A0A2A5T6T3_9GAMM|nr:50S ribosomal protein L10 [Candidatus Enterovibrio escacola]PCS23919.1 LSU ribosomal protein L10p [Candidatus Enterovibrio escacola]